MSASPDEEQLRALSSRMKSLKMPENEYENVRFGLPSGPIKFEDTVIDRKILLDHFYACGYSTFPSSKISNNFKKHVALLRASLDLWEALCGPGVMSKEEIYFRSLTEGPAFSEWVKKARATTFRALTSETDTAIEEEYFLEGYTGYNSMISEDYLIHWDDSETVDDVKYAFTEPEPCDAESFRKRVRKLFDDFRIGEIDAPKEFDMLGALKNSVMYDPINKKSCLMREFWNEKVEPLGPYFAKRSVVCVGSQNTRDTGVGDPSTILKVKQVNALCRLISEKVPYSANAPESLCNGRLKRVLRRNAFLHLDFKKFGLLFPRALTNVFIEEIGHYLEIDIDHLLIKDFHLEIDGETYKTSSGTMLGWFDCVNSLCVIAILHWIASEEDLKFDFISFNDDVEISKYVSSDVKGTLELLRLAVICELNMFGIGISLDKTFGSLGSVFLERYAYFDNYDLDMYKEQLTVKAYSKSLCTEFPWQAKLFHSAAEQWTKNAYATDRCIRTCPAEFRLEEASTSLWSGGWFVKKKNKLDDGIANCDELGLYLGIELSKFKSPNYTVPMKKVSSHEQITRSIIGKTRNAYSSEMGRTMFKDMKSISEINSDIDLIREGLQTYLFRYEGKNEFFPLRVSWLVERSLEINTSKLKR